VTHDAPPQTPAVHLEIVDHVARVTLHAPWRANALDTDMLTRLEERLRGLPDEVRVVLLCGAGARSFSTGYWIPTLVEELEQGPSVNDYRDHPLERALRAIEETPVPTIAVVGGNAFGSGCELALACDIRLGAEEARLCMPPARLGILYSATGLRRLVQLVGLSVAKELIFTAEVVDGHRALSLGLVNRLVPRAALPALAQAMAAQIAANDPLSIRHHKTLFGRYLAPPPYSEEDLRRVAELRLECFGSDGFKARSRALIEKRP
jgi:enoyl-CoA hydratase/carnithine racemase